MVVVERKRLIICAVQPAPSDAANPGWVNRVQIFLSERGLANLLEDPPRVQAQAESNFVPCSLRLPQFPNYREY
jgi:hypothetical protein